MREFMGKVGVLFLLAYGPWIRPPFSTDRL